MYIYIYIYIQVYVLYTIPQPKIKHYPRNLFLLIYTDLHMFETIQRVFACFESDSNKPV